MWACESEGRQRVLLLFVYTLFVWCIWNLWPSTTTSWSHHLNANGGILSTSPKVNRGKKRKKEEEIDRGLNYCDLEGKRLALTMRQTPSGLPLSTCIPTDRLTNPFFGRLYRIYVSISLDLDLAHGEGGEPVVDALGWAGGEKESEAAKGERRSANRVRWLTRSRLVR